MTASMDQGLKFRLLGPLEIEVAGRQLLLTAPRLQSVLGMLLLRAGETVPVQQMAECVWEERLPADPLNQVAACVSLLRRKLARAGADSDVITTEAPGYRLHVRDIQLDTHRVSRLRDEAADCLVAGEKEEAVRLLRQALTVWRGPLLAGLRRRAWQSEVKAWEEERLALREMSTDIQLELGQYERLISELSGFIAEHPFLERPRAQLMTALYYSGRRADALKVYRESSDLLNTEFGVSPGAELQQLHQDILRGTLPPASGSAQRRVRGDTGDHGEGTEPAGALAGNEGILRSESPPAGPCLLPGDVREFIGREPEIAAIMDLLVPSKGPAPIVGLIGAGGTGKTTLAVHAAHRLRPVFTAGQLYINLRGMDPDPVRPEEALARLLSELGMPESAIPGGLEERAERYRALLADQRVLIVLDNASCTEQIRPLLPGTGSCGVLITSRTRISSAFTPHVLEPGMFSQEQAIELLGRIAGVERLLAEPESARRLVEQCGRLPLAVGIVGARLASKPHWSLARVSARLADGRRLDELSHGRLTVRASLGPSYQRVSPNARWVLRRLAMLALPEFAVQDAAPLLDLSAVKAELLIEELVDARLIEVIDEDREGRLRYRIHDLVCLYAAEQDVDVKAESESQPRVITAQPIPKRSQRDRHHSGYRAEPQIQWFHEGPARASEWAG